MPEQTIIWTALPNGIGTSADGDEVLRLSVFISPRLHLDAAEGDSLDLFPDWLHWADTVSQIETYTVQLGATTVQAIPASRPALRPDWWDAMFPPDTYVKPYEFPAHSGELIISYPVMNVVGLIKELYQVVGVLGQGQGIIQPGRENVGSLVGFNQWDLAKLIETYNIPWSKRDARRVRDQLADSALGTYVAAITEDHLDYPPYEATGAAADDSSPAARKQALEKVQLFHTPPAWLYSTEEEDQAAMTEPLPPLPQDEDDFARYMDFHEAVSMLGSYPLLLRHLGLVVDLEVPIADDIAADPLLVGGSDIPVQVLPDWDEWQLGDTDVITPTTMSRLHVGGSVFRPLPRSDTSLIRDGMLDLRQPIFDLVEFDVDGGALKLMNFANSLTRGLFFPQGPESAALPALRSAGFSLNITNRDLLVYDHFAQTEDHQQKLLADGNPAFYADDLLRGYRVDVWDSMTAAWHSLCLRDGVYLLNDEPMPLGDTTDEGFAQMATTQQAPLPDGSPPPSDDLYLHESLFRWEGWSLVASRPGKSIQQEGDGSAPEEPENTPLMPYKLEVNFKAQDRSLPRLRFGSTYRLRVRIADLAGNGPGLEDAGDSLALPAPDAPPLPYLRYEPLASPYVLLRHPIEGNQDAGESLARLVIRSFNDDPDKDTTPTAETNERHIAPPPTSVQMVEHHSVLDDLAGRLRTDPGVYNALDERSQPVDMTDKEPPVVPDAQMPITYLPDPLALGAALRDLPGVEEGVIGRVVAAEAEPGGLGYQDVPGIHVRPGNVVHIPFLADETPAVPSTLPAGVQALYTFQEGGGTQVQDVSGVGTPLDLTIEDPANVTWGAGTLTLNAPTRLSSAGAATKLIDALQATNEFSVEAWIEPVSTTQDGPARIVTLAKNQQQCNFMVGQGPDGDTARFTVQVRTSASNHSGQPALQSAAGTASTALTHLLFTRAADGTRTLYVNGVAVGTDVQGGSFSTWDEGYQLALGNEFGQPNPWLGTYHRLAIYDRALTAQEASDQFVGGVVPPADMPDPLTHLLASQAFRLNLVEGEEPPQWDATDRELTLALPKATELSFPLSTYMHPDNLKLMGVWAWLRQALEGLIVTFLNQPLATELLTWFSAHMAQYTIEGAHQMLTPARQLTLVHAVQQPIGHPHICDLSAHRSPGDTDAALWGEVDVHNASTGKLDFMAAWTEYLDDLTQPEPSTAAMQDKAAEVPLNREDDGYLYVHEGDATKSVGSYNAAEDRVEMTALAAPTHEFRDTKHRMVAYHAVASSRFREYFDPDALLDFTRRSESVLVNVPNTARPAAPVIRYVIPTYGWKRETTTNLDASYRRGGGLRVYMERPWYSSGEGELLGVVLWTAGNLNDSQREALKPYITQWGMDPIWGSPATSNLLNSTHFTNAARVSNTMHLPEVDGVGIEPANKVVQIVGHDVGYDAERRLWYSDIEIEPGQSYTPFVRLALVRYQPSSIDGMHCSPVALADFAQLAPDRAAVMTLDPYQPYIVNLMVSGFTYSQTASFSGTPIPDGSHFEISVEERDPDIPGELGWRPASQVQIDPASTSASEKILWAGRITLPETRMPGQYRVVIREYEELIGYERLLFQFPRRRRLADLDRIEAIFIVPSTDAYRKTRRKRLVYADTLVIS